MDDVYKSSNTHTQKSQIEEPKRIGKRAEKAETMRFVLFFSRITGFRKRNKIKME